VSGEVSPDINQLVARRAVDPQATARQADAFDRAIDESLLFAFADPV